VLSAPSPNQARPSARRRSSQTSTLASSISTSSDQAALPTEFRERISNFRCGSGTFRMNVALCELPSFTCCRAGRSPHRWHHSRSHSEIHGTGLFRCPHVRVVEETHCRVAHSLYAGRQPGPSRAARRQSFLPARCTATAERRSWDVHRQTVADLMIDTVNEYAPNFKASVLGRQIMSPLDLDGRSG